MNLNTEKKIQNMLVKKMSMAKIEGERKFFDFAPNLVFFPWESDLLCRDRRDRIYEFEIKLSRSDFLADSKKEEKHICLGCGLDVEGSQVAIPNYFYYVIPEGMVRISELPDYAGLYIISEYMEMGEAVTDLILKKMAPILTEKKYGKNAALRLSRANSFKLWKSRGVDFYKY